MKAVGYQQNLPISHTDSLVDIDLPQPQAQGRDILVKVAAISVNPVDTKIRANVAADAGQHKVIGWDAVGEVVAVGPEVKLFNAGDRVWYAGDLTRPGSNAEYQLVDERIAAVAPSSLSNAEAAALPLTAITAWELLFDRLGLTPQLSEINNDSAAELGAPKPVILIVGAAGGVGSILTQLAAKLTDATVVATASRPETADWVKELGADIVINHHQPMLEQLQQAGLSSVTHVASLTHTDDHLDQLIEALAPQGKLALIDDPQQDIDIKKLKRKSLSLHWEFMYTRSMFSTWDMQKQHELLTRVAELIDGDVLQTTLGEHYGRINAENLKKAHALLESNKAMGKLVLEGF
ncbi:zinc-binding alcohol dehydrogenase family protein [Paraferrimonas haliotis]|uniref:Zinc-type alcohol dehydrogenase-like protein n=1 Tax=Paraferrimonas haliotis TaxID=2013866 RepID=A0AA37WY87_9GAMM|nr:zinc-binding alcohol dehydrogenase family protein [Paraferrimonas haliotis]GLS84259.1 NADPH:quinone reductase [Paraferrimonas haliotis]